MVVEAGFTVILCVVAPPGDHKKLPPPVDGVAVSEADSPWQMATELTVTVGPGLTMTSILALWLSHPLIVCET